MIEIEDLYIVKDKHTKTSQGFGFVEFKEIAGKEEALKLNGSMKFGRAPGMKVNNVTKKTNGETRLFVKGIPAEKTEADVKILFGRFGTVTNVFFIKDKVSKQSRGFGFVEFEEAANASNALSLDGSSELGGARPLMVKPARPQTQ